MMRTDNESTLVVSYCNVISIFVILCLAGTRVYYYIDGGFPVTFSRGHLNRALVLSTQCSLFKRSSTALIRLTPFLSQIRRLESTVQESTRNESFPGFNLKLDAPSSSCLLGAETPLSMVAHS